ncbi:MAG: OmpA family protein [Natronospirillum sp.]|uniref:OmpA family protein n=1 Tax=Natronospirillum sp. TaxID=2812955 RepID=UPI0025F1E253|nr:OmpA family protein [Natronospirillum sp.]MCH8550841.1 OmpA family protein [Natronospirillum sp.]
MNRISIRKVGSGGKAGLTMALASLLLTACAMGPVSPDGSAQARDRLNELQSDAQIADSARTELREAEEAVRLAEQPLNSGDRALGEHRVYMANQKVEIARAKAISRLAESERQQMVEERDAARLAARTREADRARAQMEARALEADEDRAEMQARAEESESERAEMQARADESDRTREDMDAALGTSALAAADLQSRIDELEARPAPRGLVLTLGDVLFETGSSSLEGGSGHTLDNLVAFLHEYPDRYVVIEGHTDNVGSAAFNQTLSVQRAESVREYLTDHGIPRSRIAVAGFGLDRPVASNDSATGRQQNRRVEVIIENQDQ